MLQSAGFRIFLQTVIIMKQTNETLLKWELERERFRIEDRFPPPAKRPERHISDILAGMQETESAETGALPEELVQRWPAIAGEQLSKHVQPSHVKEGILYLYTDHSGWLAELRRLPKAQLLKKISLIPGIPVIKDIRFQLDPAIQSRRK